MESKSGPVNWGRLGCACLWLGCELRSQTSDAGQEGDWVEQPSTVPNTGQWWNTGQEGRKTTVPLSVASSQPRDNQR